MRLQLEEKTAGAIMSAVPKNTFGDLLVPMIPEETQKQISNLIRQSFSLRKESKELLEKAKKEVEEFIEKNTNYNRP
jgi:restriction endonuclease S subunit